MARDKKIFRRVIILSLSFVSLFLFAVWYPSLISRLSFSAPTPSYHSWDEILAHPKRITLNTYSTGTMQTDLSAIMNLEHERAADIKDKIIELPVNAYILKHHKFGHYLIDAGLDSSYVHNPYGTIRGLLVKGNMGTGSQEPNTHIAAIIERENIQLQGVWLTHLHPDHTAGIINLPKNIPYVTGENERYINFRFFMQTDHMAGVEKLYEIDFSEGIDLPPFGKCVDLYGDGTLWAIESTGHSKGHVMYFINGIDEPVLVTGDACNNQYQFDSGIGPGYFSSDLENSQKVLASIKIFKERYPKVRLAFGHDR